MNFGPHSNPEVRVTRTTTIARRIPISVAALTPSTTNFFRTLHETHIETYEIKDQILEAMFAREIASTTGN